MTACAVLPITKPDMPWSRLALGLHVDRVEIFHEDHSGATDVAPDIHLPMIDWIAICVAGMAAEEMFDAHALHELAHMGDQSLTCQGWLVADPRRDWVSDSASYRSSSTASRWSGGSTNSGNGREIAKQQSSKRRVIKIIRTSLTCRPVRALRQFEDSNMQEKKAGSVSRRCEAGSLRQGA